jgi:secreted PhoX family phosphatase
LQTDRRRFLAATGVAFAALASGGCMASFNAASRPIGYGDLLTDPDGLIDLPRGFAYRILSSLGEPMSDGGTVPDKADGMGCFDIGNGKLVLVRNHELRPGDDPAGATGAAYDHFGRSMVPLPGGTTHIVIDARTMRVEQQYRSLSGTIRNCAGGPTPWGSWLSCEENVSRAGGPLNRDHGYVFEVPAAATGPVEPVALRAMGRFNHEAAAVDPVTGMVYMTEDRDDGLLYRFIPHVRADLARGGRLQALVWNGIADTRNWTSVELRSQLPGQASWIDLDDPDSPLDDLRLRGARAGAALFARGEGIWMGKDELYFACTNGGAARLGQIFRLRPAADGGQIDLFFESDDPNQFNYGDNLTVAPDGHLIICEDQYTDDAINHLRVVSPAGEVFTLGRLRMQTELAGACFSPDGRTLFVNAYSPTRTLAITGPWSHLG